MSIPEYLKIKNTKNECPVCKAGVLFQKLSPVRNKIERRKEDLLSEIEEDVRKIVQKVDEGDERTISNIYGDSKNTLK
jgi:hypothetical protein